MFTWNQSRNSVLPFIFSFEAHFALNNSLYLLINILILKIATWKYSYLFLAEKKINYKLIKNLKKESVKKI